MKKYILILSITFFYLLFSQTEKCSIQEIQLETYEFALNNLDRINKKFENKESLIEVTINFKKRTAEQDFNRGYAEIKNVNYHLISTKNSYNGENKKRIKIDSKLDNYILKKIDSCIENSSEFEEQLYNNIIFRIPLNETNIEKAIE